MTTAVGSTFLGTAAESEQFDELQTEFYEPDPTSPRFDRGPPVWKSAIEAVKPIKSGDKVYVHGFAATPTLLLENLCTHALENNLKDITLYHLLLEGEAEWFKDNYNGVIKSNTLFLSPNTRDAVSRGKADAVSIFLSEIPWLFRKNIVDLDVALIHVSPPDKHGFCTLGASVECTRSAVINAKHIIALSNPKMPRTFGDGIIHISHIDTMVYVNTDLYTSERAPTTEIEQKIGTKIGLELVEDGATLQIVMGDITWVNDSTVIRKNPKVTALNSAVEIDITGQVVSDSIGTRIISGFGGQVDFIRGASACRDGRGKPIIALPSTAKNGESKIVPYIKDGSGVVTTRAHVHYVVTEYGIADLFGKSMRHRAHELIKIAHPTHREWLDKMAYKRLKCMPGPDY